MQNQHIDKFDLLGFFIGNPGAESQYPLGLDVRNMPLVI